MKKQNNKNLAHSETDCYYLYICGLNSLFQKEKFSPEEHQEVL